MRKDAPLGLRRRAPRAPFRVTASNRRWWTLAGTSMGLFVLMLDSTVVTLALPSIRRDLGASSSELQWIVNAYLLAIAVLVVSVGRLGDIFGRRRVFLVGLGLFTAGLVVAATAGAVEILILARVVQGLGASALLTLSLALVSSAFDDSERPRALGIWAAISALALAIGPLVGGSVVDALSWRWVFWIGVPPLVLALLVTLRATAESRDESTTHRLDPAGLLTLSVGLTAIVLVLVEGDEWGWSSGRSLGALAVGALSLAAFAAIEPRVRQPVVEFALFRNRPYLGATAAAFCLVGAWWPLIYYVPQYLQGPLGYGPALSGLLVLPITAPMIVISPLSARLIARFGPRRLMTTGMALGTLGVLGVTRVDATSGYLTLLPGFILFGIALGLVYSPMSVAAMAAMPRAKAGIAAGVLAMNRMVSGAVMLAATGAVYAALLRHHGDDADAGATALSTAFYVPVAVCALGTWLTWWLVADGEAHPQAGAEPHPHTMPH